MIMDGKNLRTVSALNYVADMVGEKQVLNGNDVGLGLTSQHDRCLDEAMTITNGTFRVYVMGPFSSGKSTFVNAVLGSRVLPVSALPSTAILTLIQYGNDEDDVEIYFKDTVNVDGTVKPGRVERVSREEFEANYKYTEADNEEFVTTGCVSRFNEIAYAVVRCSLPLTQDGVNIVDSPGLEDKVAATKLALDAADKAQAIVYVCGERGFAEADRQYFRDNFKGNPGNVFFVMLKIDNIASDEERERAMKRMRNDVKMCFIKPDGTVDEELMAKRVFGVSALMALDARRGKAFDKEAQEDVAIDAEQADAMLRRSRFLPFEQALEEALTTDERCTAQHKKVFRTLIDVYCAAIAKVLKDRGIYKSNARNLEQQRKECLRVIDEMNTGLKAAEASFENCILKLSATMATLVNHAIDSIDNTWETDLEELHESISFGMGDYLKVALNSINVFKSKGEKEEVMRKLLKPFSDTIAKYIEYKIDRSIANNKDVLENAIKEAERSVNADLSDLAELTSRQGRKLSDVRQINKKGNTNWLQAALSGYLLDASALVRRLTGERVGWTEFIGRTVFNCLWQWFVLAVAGLGWGIVIVAIIEWLQTGNGKNKMIDRMLTSSKDAALKQIRLKLDGSLAEMSAEIGDRVHKIMDTKLAPSRQQLAKERNHLVEIDNTITDNDTEARQEKVRTDYIISELAREINNCHIDVFGTPCTEELPALVEE